MELIQNLVSSLGITEDQAKGGTGLLFNLAKEQLDGAEFQQIADKIPGVADFLKMAPESDGGVMGTLEDIASNIGGKVSGLGALASLAGGFSKLGLDTDMISKFVPTVLSFVQNQGGDTVKGLLEKVINPS